MSSDVCLGNIRLDNDVITIEKEIFSYFDVNTLNSERHTQLGPDDSEPFPAVYGASKVCICIFFLILIFEVIKKENLLNGEMLLLGQENDNKRGCPSAGLIYMMHINNSVCINR